MMHLQGNEYTIIHSKNPQFVEKVLNTIRCDNLNKITQFQRLTIIAKSFISIDAILKRNSIQ